MPNPHAAEQSLDPLILPIRGHRVILDSDLAHLYGIATKTLNQAVKRNSDRFPSDFAFQLLPEEAERWSQFVTTSPDTRKTDMRSQFVTASEKPKLTAGLHPFRRSSHLPWAFTEHGALMAATILRSDQAVHMSLYVVRTFVKLRQVALENHELSRRMAEAELAIREHDAMLHEICDKLEPLLDPQPEESPDRTLGFRKEDA